MKSKSKSIASRIISLILASYMLLCSNIVNISVNAVGDNDIYMFNGHGYKVFNDGLTWNEAKIYCENIGGHLITITSYEEQKMIEKLIANSGKNAYWLGATDSKTEGDWEWITGEKWEYSNWDYNHNQPDNDSNDEHYLQIYNLTRCASRK